MRPQWPNSKREHSVQMFAIVLGIKVVSQRAWRLPVGLSEGAH